TERIISPAPTNTKPAPSAIDATDIKVNAAATTTITTAIAAKGTDIANSPAATNTKAGAINIIAPASAAKPTAALVPYCETIGNVLASKVKPAPTNTAATPTANITTDSANMA